LRRELSFFGFLEVECPTIMPEIVWEASGHLERFIDYVTRCTKCNYLYRADKILKDLLPDIMIDGLSKEELDELIKTKNLKCPNCNNLLGKIEEYNLMLKTSVGDNNIAYLRPETATTTYLLFNRLDNYARKQYPIKVFQYGKAHRNEISPRQGVIRMRAFDQIELQLFIGKEQEMTLDEYEEVKHEKLPLLDWKTQAKNNHKPKNISLEQAIKSGYLKKPAYAYCLYISYYLTKKFGYKDDLLRFRQHSPTERSHYADDAWDLEVKTRQYGWIEVCGIHDRTDYDLRRHQEFSKQNFEISMTMSSNGKEIPQILEIAFGVDRIIYTLLENCFEIKDERINLKLKSYLAPYSVAVFPLVKNKKEIRDLAKNVQRELLDNRIASFYDEAGSIGKRYRRQDELGTPFCLTIDYESLEDQSVTIRHRDSMKQERIKIKDIPKIISEKLIFI
jgi:glycyl-tRNA synthetase